ncbi:unnamed protein product [Cylindrotheca closterium]|uniref:Uncharacterized protein n=1 Tax=Cylindrotheca closterium TaxID=2856 RepID=A0AAD2G2N6_9STRA|nr:unnamed protein product [Cylindrotheca closterium]
MSTMLLNSSLVFPTSSALQQQQLRGVPNRHGSLVVPYSTSSSLYKSALPSTNAGASKAVQGSSSQHQHIQMAKKTARALLSTVSDSSKLAGKSSSTTTTNATIKRSKASAAMSNAVNAYIPSSSSKAIPKLMHASLPLQIGIGMASACYWRGMWYVLDDQLYPQDQAKSAIASLAAGSVGLAASQAYLFDPGCHEFKWPKTATMCKGTEAKKWLALYGLTTSCILIWRGAWVGCDVVYESITNESALDPKHLTISGLASHGIALVGLLAMGRLSSTLGPPYHGTLVMKDEDKLNTKNKNLKRNMARTAGRSSRMSMVLPLVGEGYGKLRQMLPKK